MRLSSEMQKTNIIHIINLVSIHMDKRFYHQQESIYHKLASKARVVAITI